MSRDQGMFGGKPTLDVAAANRMIDAVGYSSVPGGPGGPAAGVKLKLPIQSTVRADR